MRSAIIGLLAETSLHPGAEQSIGVVDLPVAREAATGYPVIVGSSLKGALKDNAEQRLLQNTKKIFGTQEQAGAVAVTDARLLLLPVRSLSGHYKWVTCPYILERYQRDLGLAGLSLRFEIPIPVNKESAIANNTEERLFLEELTYSVQSSGQEIELVASAIAPLIKHQSVKNRLINQLVIVDDKEFSYFARYGLQVNARNQLSETKTSKNLWYEETLPPDSLFYSLLVARPGHEEPLDSLQKMFTDRPYLQVGGNETVGQGWCAIALLNQEG